MVQAVVHVVGVKVNGKLMVSRKQLCEVLSISTRTLTNKLHLDKEFGKSKILTNAGEMFDLEQALSIKIKPSN